MSKKAALSFSLSQRQNKKRTKNKTKQRKRRPLGSSFQTKVFVLFSYFTLPQTNLSSDYQRIVKNKHREGRISVTQTVSLFQNVASLFEICPIIGLGRGEGAAAAAAGFWRPSWPAPRSVPDTRVVLILIPKTGTIFYCCLFCIHEP